jgi:leucyl aminopeptidase
VNIKIEAFEPSTVVADALIIPLSAAQVESRAWENGQLAGAPELSAELTRYAGQNGYTGKTGTTLSLATVGRIPARRIILAGLGALPVTAESIRRALGAAASIARDTGAKRVAAMLPEGEGIPDATVSIEAMIEGATLATYRFTHYYGTARNGDPELKAISEFVVQERSKTAAKAVKRGQARANAVSIARDLSNEPASTLNPVEMAKRAKEVAEQSDLEITVLGPKEMTKLGMGAITAVGKGSTNEPRMIHLTYRPKKKSASDRVIGIVGKCITFDTGGYSIKTYEGMLEMKGDMSGGSAVLGAMSALRALDCPHTVHAVIAAAENMISGEAFRPGDILTAMNGVTIEVLSTDAEGRLVLADGLVYCAKQGAQEMIDLATLTGAIVVALGDGTAGLFANDDALAERVLAAGSAAGERIWRMPLIEELKDQIRGEVGDIKNSGGRPGGAITAALFIRHFAEGLPWAHLDIAGCNRTSKTSAYTPKGATGWGVRTLLEYLTAPTGAK